MARLVLLNMSTLLLLVAVGSTIAWPYPAEKDEESDTKETMEATKDDLLQELVETEEATPVAAANDDGLTAEINQAG